VGAGQGGAFLGVSLLVIVTPGQDTALTIRNTLAGGRRGGVFTALGVVSGQVTWALATSAGLAAVLVASQPAFTALRLAGAAYLVLLGVQALVAAVRARGREAAAGPRTRPAARTAYRQGLLSNLGNAKVAVFFTSLLPQFAPGGDPTFWTMLPLGLADRLRRRGRQGAQRLAPAMRPARPRRVHRSRARLAGPAPGRRALSGGYRRLPWT